MCGKFCGLVSRCWSVSSLENGAEAGGIMRCLVGAQKLALALAVALLGLLVVGGGSVSAAPPPVGVPTLGVDVNLILTEVQDALTLVVGPFILFSIGVLIVYLIWRSARKFAGGHG